MQISKKIDSLQNSSSVSIPFVSSEKMFVSQSYYRHNDV